MSSSVFALSIHADYRCRHSGACCTADWDVPVELPVYRSLNDRVQSGSLRVAPDAEPLSPFIVEPDLPDGAAAMLERTPLGECVFFERDSHLCVVHRDAGEEALPATCRHFPRLAVSDSRGTFVTLSHYCPTAASMLFRDDVSLHIVESPPAFPMADYDGLTVTEDDLPPLLSPSMLMDSTGYSAWERHMVRRCSAEVLPEAVVATLASDVVQLGTWRPGGGVALADAIGRLPGTFTSVWLPASLAVSCRLRDDVVAAIPDDLKPQPDDDRLDAAYRDHVRPVWSEFQRPINRYLAAKAFASWTAYQGRGLATIVRGLEAALALVRIEASRQCRDAGRALDRDLLLEAFRSADFALNHLAVAEELAEVWSRAEMGTPEGAPYESGARGTP
jgi:Fe-S-cluster containining protein